MTNLASKNKSSTTYKTKVRAAAMHMCTEKQKHLKEVLKNALRRRVTCFVLEKQVQ